jgi:hypothetical protein
MHHYKITRQLWADIFGELISCHQIDKEPRLITVGTHRDLGTVIANDDGLASEIDILTENSLDAIDPSYQLDEAA